MEATSRRPGLPPKPSPASPPLEQPPLERSGGGVCTTAGMRSRPCLLGMLPEQQACSKSPAIGRPPCVAGHARDAPPKNEGASTCAASGCRTGTRRRYCRQCLRRLRREGASARRCIGEMQAGGLASNAPARPRSRHHPTSADRSSSSGPAAPASFSCECSSKLPSSRVSIQLHVKRMCGANEWRPPGGKPMAHTRRRKCAAPQSGLRYLKVKTSRSGRHRCRTRRMKRQRCQQSGERDGMGQGR